MGVALSTTWSFTTTDGSWSVTGMPLTTTPAGVHYVCGQTMKQVGASINQTNGSVATEFVGFVMTDAYTTLPQVKALMGFTNAVYEPVYEGLETAAIAATQKTDRMFSNTGKSNWKYVGVLR